MIVKQIRKLSNKTICTYVDREIPTTQRCPIIDNVKETTAEIWIGPAQRSSFMGTKGGLNATHLLLLRENSRPAWLLMPGNLYDSKPPVLGRPKVWFPSFPHPIEDALLLFAVMGAKVPEVRAVLGEFEKSRNRSRLDMDASFPKGLPRQVYGANQKHLQGWHLVVSVGDASHAKKDLDALQKYKGLDIEVRETTRLHMSSGNEQ